MPDNDTAVVPSHLSALSTRWMRGILADFGDDISSTEFRLLVLAAEALDTGASARRRFGREGLLVADRFQQLKAHPAVVIARDASHTYARLVGILGLDQEEPEPEPRRGGGVRRHGR